MWALRLVTPSRANELTRCPPKEYRSVEVGYFIPVTFPTGLIHGSMTVAGSQLTLPNRWQNCHSFGGIGLAGFGCT